jgi:hypothetical protein
VPYLFIQVYLNYSPHRQKREKQDFIFFLFHFTFCLFHVRLCSIYVVGLLDTGQRRTTFGQWPRDTWKKTGRLFLATKNGKKLKEKMKRLFKCFDYLHQSATT